MTADPGAAVAAPPMPTGVPTVGVEEEFFLLRPDGHVAAVAPELLGALAPGVRGTAEFARCQVETSTAVCADLATLGLDLALSRQVLARAAADRGAHLVAVGTPPVGRPGASALTDDERYRRLIATVPGVTGEEITCAGQVHVAMPSRDLGAAVLGRLRPWLPVLLALAGNSPYWRGRDTGWCSHRFVVQRRWPSFVPPPVCADAAAYDERVAEFVATAAALDERGIYFWARLSPRYPTIEIRITDAFLTVADAVLVAGLCRAAVMTAVADEAAGRPVLAVPDGALVAAATSAAHHGLSAVVVDPAGIVGAFADALDAAGDRQLIESLLAERLRGGSGADRQRALWRRGPRAAAVAALAELTADLDG